MWPQQRRELAEANMGETHNTDVNGRALMQRELDEQPQLLAGIAATLEERGQHLRAKLDPRGTVYAGGCGDSLFAAEALAPHFAQHGASFRPVSAAQMLWEAPIVAGDTAVAISISGSTKRTVEALGAAKAAGAFTIAVTINGASPLAQEADAAFALPYQPVSRAIPHGLDYHVTLLSLASLAAPLHVRTIASVFDPPDGQVMATARQISGRLARSARFFFLGSGGAARGTAAFAAAKLHEAAGLPAFSHEAENFAHGALFMLREGDHVTLLGGGGPGDRRTLALRPGLERLGVFVSEAGFVPEGPDHSLRSALAGALHAQGFCLALAEAWDLDVINPGGESALSAVQKDWFGWSGTER